MLGFFNGCQGPRAPGGHKAGRRGGGGGGGGARVPVYTTALAATSAALRPTRQCLSETGQHCVSESTTRHARNRFPSRIPQRASEHHNSLRAPQDVRGRPAVT
eukprot:6545865-Pyramimonas_sp.AAC.1